MIKYNKDNTYNIGRMTKEEKENYRHAYEIVQKGMRQASPRDVVEEYITEDDIRYGYIE